METPANASSAKHQFDRLGTLITEAMDRLHVPGVAVGVLLPDDSFTAGYGITSLDNPLPVTADTLFQIGSITKTVTATIAMRLVEQDKLDLDFPVRRYLPELRLSDEPVASRVTMKHLFTHTGGWVGDYFNDFGGGDDALAKIVASLEPLPQLTPLGKVWSYNNSGFYIAGRVIEAITGQTYESVARELVLEPLGMSMSFFFPGDVMTYRFAVGHNEREGKTVVARPWPLPRALYPVGGIISSVGDLLTYARFHMGMSGAGMSGAGQDQPLLKPETLALMQSPQVSAGGATEHMGITWMLRHFGGLRVVEHSGTTNGQVSAFLMVPERHFAITLLTNSETGGQLNGEITKWTLEHFCSVNELEPPHLTLSEEQLMTYTGRYTGAANDFQIMVQEGALILQVIPKGGFPTPDTPPPPADPPVRLAFVRDEDHILALDQPIKGARAEFLRDADGGIVWLRIGGRIHKRARDD
jgi:CubicO group peptidase (beta-lactamase class C family)